MKVYKGIFVLFTLYLSLWVDQNFSQYANEAGDCLALPNQIRCYIRNNNTEAIKSLLTIGSQGTTNVLVIHKWYSSDKGSLTLDIEVSPNIEKLYLYLMDNTNLEQIILRASSINTNITFMYCNRIVTLESQNFFNQFVGIKTIQFYIVVTDKVPSFTRLSKLESLTVRIQTPEFQVLDSSIVSGLRNLSKLFLQYSSFKSIKEGAFDNMDSLESINLDYNEINSIEDDAFRGLTYLTEIRLVRNGLRDVSDNAFRGLNELIKLNLIQNPEFPLSALIPLKKLLTLNLHYNDYQTLDPFVFQQLNSIKELYLYNPLTCDCNLQWASHVTQFGIQVKYSYCQSPVETFGLPIGNRDIYINCTQTESYQCFNSSAICQSHEVCYNTKDSYYCGCPTGYELNGTSQCTDINECMNKTNCKHSCLNTKGTFQCACNEGYMLSADGYDCEDINECDVGNGGCEFGCENSIGSYNCYCDVWQELYNNRSCTVEKKCEMVASNYDPTNCLNTESVLQCKGDYNLSIINLSCTSPQVALTLMEAIPTLALIIVLFILVVALTIVIIALIMCNVKMKARASTNPKKPPNQPKGVVSNESLGAENLKQLPTEMDTDVTIPEKYPGSLEDGTVYVNVNQ